MVPSWANAGTAKASNEARAAVFVRFINGRGKLTGEEPSGAPGAVGCHKLGPPGANRKIPASFTVTWTRVCPCGSISARRDRRPLPPSPRLRRDKAVSCHAGVQKTSADLEGG